MQYTNSEKNEHQAVEDQNNFAFFILHIFILTLLTVKTEFCYMTLHQTVTKCIMQFKQNENESLIKFQ